MAIDYTKMLNQLYPQKDGEDHLSLRVGVVSAVNADGTVDLTIFNGTVPGVPRLADTSVTVGQVVQVLSYRGSLLVIGPVALSAEAAVSTRVATMTPRVADSAGTDAGTNLEIVVDTVVAPLVAGRTYKIRWEAGGRSTVAADTGFFRIREDSLTGTQAQNIRVHSPLTGGSGSKYPAGSEVEYTAVATGNKTFVGTLQRASGTGSWIAIATTGGPTYFYVDYIRG